MAVASTVAMLANVASGSWDGRFHDSDNVIWLFEFAGTLLKLQARKEIEKQCGQLILNIPS